MKDVSISSVTFEVKKTHRYLLLTFESIKFLCLLNVS